jgi:hypothetical protein
MAGLDDPRRPAEVALRPDADAPRLHAQGDALRQIPIEQAADDPIGEEASRVRLPAQRGAEEPDDVGRVLQHLGHRRVPLHEHGGQPGGARAGGVGVEQ